MVCVLRFQTLLLRARNHGSDRSNPDAASDVTHQIKNAGRVSHFLLGDGIVGDGRQWNEQQAHGAPLENLRPENVPVTRIQAQVAEQEQSGSRSQVADREQLAWLDLGHQDADNGHTQE